MSRLNSAAANMCAVWNDVNPDNVPPRYIDTAPVKDAIGEFVVSICKVCSELALNFKDVANYNVGKDAGPLASEGRIYSQCRMMVMICRENLLVARERVYKVAFDINYGSDDDVQGDLCGLFYLAQDFMYTLCGENISIPGY
ncbi:MAG: hypothetical protein M0P69_21470 [Bacteroidales bacterium]|nr:hypothetical protein [Bacteroidales bacterium]